MVRGVSRAEIVSKIPNTIIEAGKKVKSVKKIDLPAKLALSLNILNSIKEPNKYDVFEMKCSEYEDDGSCPLFSCNPYP